MSVLAADEVDVAPGVHWEKTSVREFYEKHPVALAAAVGFTIASLLVGVFLAGVAGLAVGILLGVIGSALGLLAMTKVREKTIERGG